MKVFLTGTSGLLGSNVLIELQKRNYEVRALFRNEEDAYKHREVKDIELFMGDITDAEAMRQGVAGCDIIIHAAADTGLWPSRSREYEQTNVQGTVNLIEAGKEAKVQRMISVSTANALGFGTKAQPGDETTLPRFAEYGLGYMETKHLAQEMLLREVRENGFPGLVVNPTFMIGPHDHKPSSGRMVLAVYEGNVPGYPVGGKNYVYVGDAATAIVNAIEQGRIGECYILGNENLSYQEAFTKIAKVVGVKPPRFSIPPALTKAFGMIGSAYGTLSGTAPKVSYKMAQVSCDGHYFTAAKAVRELNLPQTPIDAAIKECFDWFRDNGYLDPTPKDRQKKGQLASIPLALNSLTASAPYQIIPVRTSQDQEDFRRLPYRIYGDDPHWIPHIRQEVEAVFDPKQNTFFTHGQAERWIMKNASGEVIGRVAAFINERKAHTFTQPTGGMGFFECVDEETAAFALFDQCKAWLSERQMEAMDGPVNFGENNKYWGLITENFELPPYYGQNYNPPYYIKFFENYGFQIYFNQIIFHRSFHDLLPELYQRRADRLKKQGTYELRYYEKSKSEVYAKAFMDIYNDAWQTHDNFKPMTEQQAMTLLKQIKPVVDEDMLYFVYHEGEPVAFMIALPNINTIYRRVGDNMNLWGKLKFLYYQKTLSVREVYGVAFGVKQKYQMRGIEGLIFDDIIDIVQHTPNYKYDNYIVTWVGDFNPSMIRVMEALGAKQVRTLSTYRKLFDQSATFERSPIIGQKKEKTVEHNVTEDLQR